MDEQDRGSSVVEFVMIATLLVFLLFAVLQIALYSYVRSVVASAAQDGARYGANEGIGPLGGAQRAQTLMTQRIATGERYNCAGSPGIDAASGLRTTTIRCSGDFRAVLLPFRVRIDVAASALQEQAP